MYAVSIAIFILFEVANASRLFGEELKKRGYEKNERPYFASTSVNISVQLFVHSIGPIDEHDFTFVVGFYLQQWWMDPRLASNSTLHSTSLKNFIWLPDTSVQDARKVKEFPDAVRTIVQPSGLVYYSRRLEATTICEMDLKFYPMDTQKCELIFESYAFATDDINISWHKAPISKSPNLNLNGYQLISIEREATEVASVVGNELQNFKFLKVYFSVERTLMFHIYLTYIPSMLLLIFAFCSFWVPETAVPARVGMIITSFLANIFILQGVSEKTVRVSYTTPMQIFLVANISLIACSLLEYVIILQLKRKRELHDKAVQRNNQDGTKNGRNVSVSEAKTGILLHTNGHMTKTELTSKNNSLNMVVNGVHSTEASQPTLDVPTKDIHMIDRFSRIFFPVLYILFCSVYFGFYLKS
ncbi:gamma-aminobutyric acid receptor subunit rho-1-like [Hydractinia symbiolongicarpus]|uniref:gamma-aminobutyric acid receptor subunit rho-1-like n=1 Tax=Hydractinia symbiolongicarpus TaxID=13093 RepID=UPI00254E1B5E|nr:gamma-aminobutyric acid receptor subunit rho-1-like [Hydractinia symbiolongicarpus]